MLEDIITYITISEYLSNVLNHIEVIVFDTNRYINDHLGIKFVSIVLMLFAVLLFFITLLFVSLRAIFSPTNSKKKKSRCDSDENMSVFFDEEETDFDDEQNEMQYAVEQLEKAETEKEYTEKDNRRKKLMRDRELEEEADKKENKKNPEIELDWEKGKIKEIESANLATQVPNLEYKQSEKELYELVGLIVDMISRGVDEFKIAQTIVYRNKGKNTEDDVLQIIESIKEFIDMCNNNKFNIIKNRDKLPSEREALISWAKGDTSMVMILLQALIDEKINKSMAAGIGQKREVLFKEASYLAFHFGAISYMEDSKLAINALELSIELDPKNTGAWNKVADAYFNTEDPQKAVWAYRNVLKVAKASVDDRYMANASRMLSKAYLEDEEYEKAEELFNISKEYYDRIGINKRLDKKEIEIIGLIEAKQYNEVGNVVSKVLGGREN